MSSSPAPSGARQRNKHTSSRPSDSSSEPGSSDPASNGETLKANARSSPGKGRRKNDGDGPPPGTAGSVVLKALAGLAVLAPALSYLIMDGESFTFGYNPRWAKWEYWVRTYLFPSFTISCGTQGLKRETTKIKK